MKRQLIYACLLVFISNAAAITYDYMDQMCGQTIDLSFYDSVRLQLTSSSNYRPNMNCYIKVKTDYSSRIMLYFKSFGVESTCTNDWLEVRDGQYSSSSYVSGLYGHQCGYYMSSTVRKTSGNYLYLRFVSDNSLQSTGFDMILTSYHTGICYSYEYSCSNGRCIDDSLTCNGYNPCGDYSDCSIVLATGSIAGIVVGCIFFVIVISIVMVVVCRRRRLAYVGAPIQPVHAPVNVITTSTGSGGYNQPVPQQYPQPYVQQQMPPPYAPGGQYPQQY